MEFELLIPIVLFLCITYCVKLVIDARLRSRMLKEGGSTELMRSMVQNEQQQRRQSSLRSGLILTAVAIGFGTIQAFGWNEINAGVVAVLAAATGLGNLVFYALTRKLD
ncbi:hypothetical protein [Dokdonella ginsengisoli]|uniref:DUF3784 domain-containing protein n=1 Tax=Dokdonella ginsengisoli TaxID=363846 RepID=A0ABV9QTC1_9GAMM